MENKMVKTNIKIETRCVFLLLFMLFVSLPSAGLSREIKITKYYDTRTGEEVEIIAGEIVVIYETGVSSVRAHKINVTYGAIELASIEEINTYLLKIPANKSVEEMISIYQELNEVKKVMPNIVIRIKK
jgi:hypothetical protein